MVTNARTGFDWFRFGIVVCFTIVVIIADARTKWLMPARDALSVALTPVRRVASFPASVERFLSGVLSAEPDIKVAYENLRNEYFQLKSEVLLLRGLEQENQNLRTMLDASQRLSEKVILAELSHVSIDPYNHRILIGRGVRHGVYEGQAVIDDQGVIGQVTEVMPFNSTVMLITDPSHALPVNIKRNGLRTAVYGSGSLSSLNVLYLNQNSDIMVGDELYSSGLGGRFPADYPVATVTRVEKIPDQAFMEIAARPIAKLDRSNYVLLLSRGDGKPSEDDHQ